MCQKLSSSVSEGMCKDSSLILGLPLKVFIRFGNVCETTLLEEVFYQHVRSKVCVLVRQGKLYLLQAYHWIKLIYIDRYRNTPKSAS